MDQPERDEVPKAPFTLLALGRHLFFIGIALVITVLVFEFWGQLGSAMGTVLALPDTPKKNNGEVTVTIIPTKPCPKDQKC